MTGSSLKMAKSARIWKRVFMHGKVFHPSFLSYGRLVTKKVRNPGGWELICTPLSNDLKPFLLAEVAAPEDGRTPGW